MQLPNKKRTQVVDPASWPKQAKKGKCSHVEMSAQFLIPFEALRNLDPDGRMKDVHGEEVDYTLHGG